MGGILGYARVSTGDQDVAGQTMRLENAGAIKVFTDVISGKSMERPGLAELIAYARKGDTLAVVRLDRLGRSLTELLATVETLRSQGIALLSLEEKIDTSSAAGESSPPFGDQRIVIVAASENDGTETQTSDSPVVSHVSTSKGSTTLFESVNHRFAEVGQSA